MQILPADGGSQYESNATVSVEQLRRDALNWPTLTRDQFIQQVSSDPWSRGDIGFSSPKLTVPESGGGGGRGVTYANHGAVVSPAATPAAIGDGSVAVAPPADYLSNLLAWLQAPVSSTISIPWYMLLLAAGAAIYLMREDSR